MDVKNCTATSLAIAVPSLNSTGASGHPADFMTMDHNIIVDPTYSNSPVAGVDPALGVLINTHGNPGWYWLGGTIKIGGSSPSQADGMDIIGTAGLSIMGLHVEGAKNCVHFLAPTSPEASQDHAINLDVSCGNPLPGGNTVLIDAGVGFPLTIHNTTGLPGSGGCIIDDLQSGFGCDSSDAFLAEYISLGPGSWRIASTSQKSATPQGEDFYATSGGAILSVGHNDLAGTLTKYGCIRGIASFGLVLSTCAGAGDIDLRPNGDGSMVGQIDLNSTTGINYYGSSNFPLTISQPTLTAQRTLTIQDVSGVWPVQAASYVAASGCAMFGSDGRLTNNGGVGCNTGVVSTFSAGNGAAATPSYTFTNDTASGLFLATTSDVGFSLAGTESFRFLGTATKAMILGASFSLGWGSSGVNTIDAAFKRSGANALALVTTIGGSTPAQLSLGGLTLNALNQQSASNTGGTCTMASGTTCQINPIAHTYTTPVCIATQQGTGTVIAGECSVSGAVVTITAASSNSNTWGAIVFGNPN
jgi:hypothetical protein